MVTGPSRQRDCSETPDSCRHSRNLVSGLTGRTLFIFGEAYRLPLPPVRAAVRKAVLLSNDNEQDARTHLTPNYCRCAAQSRERDTVVIRIKKPVELHADRRLPRYTGYAPLHFYNSRVAEQPGIMAFGSDSDRFASMPCRNLVRC
jgi:hypothetical protein